MMLAGYLVAERREQIGGAEHAIEMKLTPGTPKTAKLYIESAPTGAIVEVNGNLRGETPLKLDPVAAGSEMTLRILKEGYYPHTIVYSIPPDHDAAVPVKLVPESGPRSLARLKVESLPAFAEVYKVKLDGTTKRLGRTSRLPVDLNIPVGAHIHLRAQKKGLETAETTLEVRDPYYTVYLRLPTPQRFPGKLSILGQPGVTVYLKSKLGGARELGVTPIRNHQIPEGSYELTLVDTTSGHRQVLDAVVKRNETLEKSVVVTAAGLTVK